MTAPLGSAFLGVSTFFASQHGADECDSRGLPLTLNSINITGRFQALKQLQHANICAYLDIIRLRNERLIVVSEYYNDCLENHIKSGQFSSPRSLCRVAHQVLLGLEYLNEKGITHRKLSPANILITPQGTVKLHNYALYYMTRHGQYVNFPIGYMAPETIMAGPSSRTSSSHKVDIWSLGVILLELFMGTQLYPDLFLRNALGTLFKRVILLLQNYQRQSVSPLSALVESHNCADKPMESNLRLFLEACLTPLPSKRPTASALLSHPLFDELAAGKKKIELNGYHFLPSPFLSLTRCHNLELPSHLGPIALQPCDNLLTERSLREVYYLWSLAGGDLELELKKTGLIQTRPPICNLPCLVVHDGGEAFGMEKDRVTLYDSTVLTLSLEQIEKRLEGMTTEDYYPLLEPTESGESSMQSQEPHESSTLPLAIKEKDVEYQFHRMVLFTRLLESYPYSRDRIVSEALVDVCPLVRAEIWAALLGVQGDIHSEYTAIDKDTEIPTDRQIAVDIPRCHQYDALLSSSEGHRKFQRILKSWVVSHKHLVYWQGLDSLCAPLLSLNFNNEALAYSCLSAFICKYLHKFFLRDNSPIMQEYLAVFSHLLAFHDPELFNHLDSITFIPELYAIPWFLTMFTHILPLNKIYHLWDTLLLGNCSFPLCVGVAILQQLRGDLLSFEFNDCILMFSDLPDIDIQQCVNDAVITFHSTPPSACVRKYEHIPTQHSTIPPEARREPLSLATLKSESCPQISAHDLITLCRLETQALSYSRVRVTQTCPLMARGAPRKTSGGGRRHRQKAFVVDIRPQEEFRLGHIPNSISLPHTQAFQPDGSLTPSQSASTLINHRGRVIIVVANKGEAGPNFARQLVRLAFPKVCVLHGGAGVLRSLGLLSSIQDDP